MPTSRQRKRAQHARDGRKTVPLRGAALATGEIQAATSAPNVPRSGQVRLGRRGLVFAALCAICVIVASGAIAWAVVREETGRVQGAGGPLNDVGAPGTIERLSQSDGAVMFRSMLEGDRWNQVGVVPLGSMDGGRSMVPLRCLRIHFAADRGLCLAEGNGPPGTFAAYVLDSDLRETDEVRLGGLPSRTRVSPDARYGAATSFVTGHSYAEDGFSTETLLLDLDTGTEIANVEEFTAYKDGKEFSDENFNYWGVTFTQDSNRFYATLGSGKSTYLVQGDIAERRVDVLRENVECPSLSPDNSRIAFKKRVGENLNGPGWRFHVLDLATMTETPLAETRSIDDQIMWLDNERVLYGDGTDTWVMPADGSGQPERFMSKAISPVILPSVEDSTGTPTDSGVAGGPTVEEDVLTLPEADIGVSIDMPDTATAGVEMTYTVTVTNNGPHEATSLVLDTYLPDRATFGEVTLVDPADMQYGCSAYPEEFWVRCETRTLAPGATWTVAITVTPEAAETSTVWANAGATETDLDADNDHARVDFTIDP